MATQTFRWTLASLVLSTVVLPAQAQEKVLLAIKGKEGSFGRYTDDTNVSLDAAGQKVTIGSKETSKVTVTKVEADGTVTFERKSESSEMTVNGDKLPSDDKPSTTTRVVKSDGSLVSFLDDESDPDDDHIGIRIWQAQAPFFLNKAVGIGDKWKKTYKADSKLGTRSAEAEFSLVAFEEAVGAKCAKLDLVYHETGATPAMSSKVTLWVEIASGDVVQSNFSFENVPFPGPSDDVVYAKAVGSGKRVGGGPLPDLGPKVTAEPEGKKIDDVTKGFEKLEGPMTVYRKREAGRQTIYLELKREQLGQNLMLQATAATGTSKQVVTGTPIGDIVFNFSELQPDKVTLVVPDYSNRATGDSETERAVRRSFADSFVEQFNVEARSKERDSLLIDVSDLFRGDIARLSSAFQSSGLFVGGGSSYSLDREKTFVANVKAFPDNVVVETQYNLIGSGAPSVEDALGSNSGRGDSRSVAIKVVYNLFPLKDGTGYVPRLFDPRIGYFTVWFQDFSQISKDDQQVQYVTRWNLRKKNSDQPQSEPVKPILFWIDNAVPKKYREPLMEGILTWNKAFEKLGIKGAIEVKQMPDDADWDPADMRYNMIRWVTSASDAYAVSQPRVNPLTGEIINGSILVDANLVRVIGVEQGVLVDPSQNFIPRSKNPRDCRLVQEGLSRAWIGAIAATSPLTTNKISSDDYFKQFLKNVICHEFGHMLGLRHNFSGSTELSLAELADPAKVSSEQPSSSVMDYVPFNISAIGSKGVDYYGQSLGTYDYWAIQYGYTDFGARRPQDESKALSTIASQCNLPGHLYESDESADGFDPYVTRFDLSSEPLDYWNRVASLGKSLLDTLKLRSPAKGESYYLFTREVMATVNIQAQASLEMTRYVGGLRRNGNFKGDPGEKPTLTPLPSAVQRRALDLVCKAGLSPSSFAIPKSYLTYLTDNPNANPVESLLSGENPFNVLDMLSSLQSGVMAQLLSPDRLALVVNNEFKSNPGSKPLLCGEVFSKVQDSIWSELAQGSSISILRRQLQRKHIDKLISLGVKSSAGLPADVKMWAWSSLKDLKARIGAARKKTTDPTTEVHLDECSMRIQKALDAVDSVGGSSGGRPSLSDLLGG